MTETVQLSCVRSNFILKVVITPYQMYDTMCKATAFSGVTTNVLGNAEKTFRPNAKKIQTI